MNMVEFIKRFDSEKNVGNICTTFVGRRALYAQSVGNRTNRFVSNPNTNINAGTVATKLR